MEGKSKLSGSEVWSFISKIERAFNVLRFYGYTCYQTFWCCMSCGWSALSDEEAKKAVFYTEQDREHMIDGEVYLAWSGSPIEIIEALNSIAGISAEWKGTGKDRIRVLFEGV